MLIDAFTEVDDGGVDGAAVDLGAEVGALAARMPVVLASRCATGPVFAQTYGYPGGEIDLIRRGATPGGLLSGPKARLLLGLALRDGDRDMAAAAFAPYQ